MEFYLGLWQRWQVGQLYNLNFKIYSPWPNRFRHPGEKPAKTWLTSLVEETVGVIKCCLITK